MIYVARICTFELLLVFLKGPLLFSIRARPSHQCDWPLYPFDIVCRTLYHPKLASLCALQQAKRLGGKLDVLFSKGLHEEIGVVVALSKLC